MEIKEAINVVEQVCANYRGTLQEHQHIQKALSIIKEEVKCKSNE